MKRHLLYILLLFLSVVAAAVGSQIRGDSYELLTGRERDFALHMEAYKGATWFAEAKRDVEAGLQTYREQRGLSQDEMFELLERTLARCWR